MRWAAALIVITVPALAVADDDAKARAKAHADEAKKLFDVQQYTKAAEAWQQAYLIDAEPNYLYASAQALRLGGDCVKALRAYNAYLRTNPSDPSPAQANIERCEQYLKDHPPPPDQPTIAPAPVVPAPSMPQPITTTEEAPPPNMIERPWTADWAGHAFVGGGVVVAGAGVALWLGGRATIDDNNTATTYEDFNAAQGKVDSARTRMTIGVSAMAVGGAAIIGGIVHYVLYTRPVAEPRVTASITSGAASLVLAGTF